MVRAMQDQKTTERCFTNRAEVCLTTKDTFTHRNGKGEEQVAENEIAQALVKLWRTDGYLCMEKEPTSTLYDMTRHYFSLSEMVNIVTVICKVLTAD